MKLFKIICLLILSCFAQQLAANTIHIVAVGDVGLNSSGTRVYANGTYLGGKFVSWENLHTNLSKLINGDINFMNLETIVSSNNSLKANYKKFTFRSHPNGVASLFQNGFNLVSLANNHMYDYGSQGLEDTLLNLQKLQQSYHFYYAGAGKNLSQATQPAIFYVDGYKFAFTAIGIGNGASATQNRPGIAFISHWKMALSKLKQTQADFKIVSIHIGIEKNNHPTSRQLTIARAAIADYGANLVICHHTHVVQGIEHYKNGLIFYGLGNFMLLGARNMGAVPEFKNTKDFGLVVDIAISKQAPYEKFQFQQIKAIPVYDMHSKVHMFESVANAHKRINVLNQISHMSYINANWHGKGGYGKSVYFSKTANQPWGIAKP